MNRKAACIPGTQEIEPIPPLLSAKVDPQREKDIQIELLDNEKKKPTTQYGSINSITNTTSAPIGSQITNQPGSIIPSVTGNIPATEYPASFISVTPSTHHSQFVIPTPFRPPAPALFVVNSCNYTAATLAGFGLQRYIEEIPGVVLNIDREKRELMLADGSLNKLHLDAADGAITMNDEADAIRLQRFIHKPTQPGGKKWLEDEDEIGVLYGTTLRIYSVLYGLLQYCEPVLILLKDALIYVPLLILIH
ncbi:MAG: hypothetical protein EZS28_029806 [Streblomastix strix]|uniref:Uncharacterized protein n=1 Tax=Streblomastix strix TaxID=222440 RepID=A0A5J4UWK5_9EUKA|nr:MAG: hypothetical protein EZS28_029806 [Streblomastix strix]